MSRDPLAGNTGEDNGPREPVHETTMDSRPGEEETGRGAVLVAPRHRSGMDAGSLRADAQGWGDRHRWGTAEQYEANLEANLSDLLERIKSGRYQAPPVRRTYIPKADGTQRPLGIPTFEDKVAPRAIAMVLEAVYEQDFRSCSYGFRPERSAHQALRTLHSATTRHGQYWVLDIDVRKYFD